MVGWVLLNCPRPLCVTQQRFFPSERRTVSSEIQIIGNPCSYDVIRHANPWVLCDSKMTYHRIDICNMRNTCSPALTCICRDPAASQHITVVPTDRPSIINWHICCLCFYRLEPGVWRSCFKSSGARCWDRCFEMGCMWFGIMVR